MAITLPHIVRLHKALAHPARVRILLMLRAGELCSCQITSVLKLAPSTVSAHVAELRRAGLLSERKEGRWVHYRLAQAEDTAETSNGLWKRLRRDPQVRSDAAIAKQLRKVPVEKLCAANLDLGRLAMAPPV